MNPSTPTTFGRWSQLLSCSAAILMSLGCGGGRDAEEPKEPVPWIPFQLPRSQVTLPALLVGEHGLPSSGCWKPVESEHSKSANEATWTDERKHAFNSSVKAKFSNYLAKAGLEANVARALTEEWSLHVEGLSISKVDLAEIEPNFENGNCTEPELKWFVDRRFVMSEAVKAESVTINVGSAMSAEQKAKLEVAIASINTEFGAAFDNSKDAIEKHELKAANVYVGGMGSKLIVDKCGRDKAFDVEADTLFPVCGNDYKVKIVPSTVGDRYTFVITPSHGNTDRFDEEFGVQKVRRLGKNRIVQVLVERSGAKLKVHNLSVMLVGASG